MSVVAALIVLYGYQLRHGTYLGRAWVIAAVVGMVTAAWLGAAVWTSNRRRRPAAFRLSAVFLVLVALSASAIGFPFPLGPYGKVQAFFNVAKAAMLGFEVVTCTALLALMAYALLRHQSAARRREPPAGLATGHDADPDQDG